jgi:DNA-binding transcriptional ArsR family regulator
MPYRIVASDELARVLSAMAHPVRIRIIEDLRNGAQDVGSLESSVGVSQSSVSQHLALLKASHIVESKREGRNVFYSLTRPWTASWIAEGLKLIDTDTHSAAVAEAAKLANETWQKKEDDSPGSASSYKIKYKPNGSSIS